MENLFIQDFRNKQIKRNLPFQVTLELTPLCNFKCKMCYIRNDNLETQSRILPVSYWMNILDDCKKIGVLYVTFTGGEVFFHPHFKEIYEYAYKCGFIITIITNGYLLSEINISWLKKMKPYYIKLTLYGASDETYKTVCKISDGFTKVSKNIELLKEAGIPFWTCMTAIRDNEKDIALLEQWSKEKKIRFEHSNLIRMPVRGAKSDIFPVRIIPEYSDTNDDTIQHTCNLYDFVIDKPFSCYKAYRSSCIITWQGDIIACNFINSIRESTHNSAFIESYQKLWKRLDKLQSPKKCHGCKYLQFCNPCPGTLEGESGDPEKISPYVCAIARENYRTVNLVRKPGEQPEQIIKKDCD